MTEAARAPDAEDDDLESQLRAHYLGGAAGRLAAVDRVLAAARAAPADAAATEALFRQLHTLAGSAGTYGFTQISADARALEKQVKAAREQGTVPRALLDAVADFRTGMAAQMAAAGAVLEPQPPALAVSPPSADSAAAADSAADPGNAAGVATAAPGASAFAAEGMAGPDDGLDGAADPITRPLPAPAPPEGAAAEAAAAAASSGVPQKPLARRLLLAVIDGGSPLPQLAADAGNAVALAGAHLACSGPSPAARAFRAAGGDGQVIAFLDADQAPANGPADGSAPDLPLPCGTRAVRNAMLAHACDAALLCAESPEAIADARAVLRAGRPLAVAAASPGLKKALGAPAHLIHEGPTLQHAVLQLLLALAPGAEEAG